jgi:hypothetical protein
MKTRRRFTGEFKAKVARRGLCYRAHDGEDRETGGVNTNPIHLSQAPNCLEKRTHFF